MNEQDNLKAVHRIYNAFNSGNIPAALAEIAEDVRWWLAGPEEIPYAGTYCGHNGVLQMFELLGQAIEVEMFEPREFIVEGKQVVVLGQEAGRAKTTGCHFVNEWAQVFSFANGKLIQFREFGDTAALVSAFTGQGKEQQSDA